MNTELIRKICDAKDNSLMVFAVHGGELVQCQIISFQTDPFIIVLDYKGQIFNTENFFFNKPEKVVPEKGREVRHINSGLSIISSGKVDSEGCLVGENGVSYTANEWVDDEFEAAQATKKKLEEEEKERLRLIAEKKAEEEAAEKKKEKAKEIVETEV